MARVLIPLAKGFEDLEAVSTIDILRRGGVEVVTASPAGALEVESAHGIVMRADRALADVIGEPFDAILLPGGGEGTQNLLHCEALLERLRRQKEEGKFLCAICAAPTVFQEAGLLDPSQFVTCYPTCQMQVDCNWVNEPVVEHEGIITGQAPGSAMIFSLVVLKALTDEVIAKKVARGMVFDF